MKNKTYIGITILLITIILFCIRGTVVSQSFKNQKAQQGYISKIEKNYIADVKNLLEQKGIIHSGINFTSITEEDGKVEYTMVINHNKIEKLSLIEKNQLLVELEQVHFPDDTIEIFHEFLTEF